MSPICGHHLTGIKLSLETSSAMDVNVLVLCNQIPNLKNYGINLYLHLKHVISKNQIMVWQRLALHHAKAFLYQKLKSFLREY